MTLLEVFIPTYNRLKLLEKCLLTVEQALVALKPDDAAKVGILINNNSTMQHQDYENLIKSFYKAFTVLGVSYFDYRITGFNIGSINNIIGGILSAKADYVWCLPDDDCASQDSILTILRVIEKYSPSFIHGGWLHKTTIKYYSDINDLPYVNPNKVSRVIHGRSKINFFLDKNVVQLQEHVYLVDSLKKYLLIDSWRRLLDDMSPGYLALLCLKADKPFVVLENSIGVFRDGDDSSSWRHLWLKFALIDWPILSCKLLKLGVLDKMQCKKSIKVFNDLFFNYGHRPDLLLGLQIKSRINPLMLLRFHCFEYLTTILLAPVSIYVKLINK